MSKAKQIPEAKPGSPALRAFLDDWFADEPAEAAGGTYGAHVRDRWNDRTFDIPDGEHTEDLWTFSFEGGRFIGAVALF